MGLFDGYRRGGGSSDMKDLLLAGQLGAGATEEPTPGASTEGDLSPLLLGLLLTRQQNPYAAGQVDRSAGPMGQIGQSLISLLQPFVYAQQIARQQQVSAADRAREEEVFALEKRDKEAKAKLNEAKANELGKPAAQKLAEFVEMRKVLAGDSGKTLAPGQRISTKVNGMTISEAGASPLESAIMPLANSLQGIAKSMKQEFTLTQNPDGSTTATFLPRPADAAKAAEALDNISMFDSTLGRYADAVNAAGPEGLGAAGAMKRALPGLVSQSQAMVNQVRRVVSQSDINPKTPLYKQLFKLDKNATDVDVLRSALVYQAAAAIFGQSGKTVSDADVERAAALVGDDFFTAFPEDTQWRITMLRNLAAENKKALSRRLSVTFTPDGQVVPTSDLQGAAGPQDIKVMRGTFEDVAKQVDAALAAQGIEPMKRDALVGKWLAEHPEYVTDVKP
jgi:hypothetical protein